MKILFRIHTWEGSVRNSQLHLRRKLWTSKLEIV
jgi:hypothetical protein